MPYSSNEDLPTSVKNVLPSHAQDIYRKSFNSAFDQYDGSEETAHKVAWSAVKNSYKKNDAGEWVKKSG
jgi:cation transport regulator